MKPPITLVHDDELSQPYSMFDYWLGKLTNVFAAIGMVTAAGLVGYFFGG